MKKLHYTKLVERYMEGTSTEEEDELFFYLLRKGKLKNYLIDATVDEDEVIPFQRSALRNIWRYGVAAAILVLIGSGVLWIRHEKPTSVASNVFKNDVKPGGDHAVLTLANGSQIVLNNVKKGNLGSQGGAQIIQLDSGSLSYKAGDNAQSSNPVYNMITTPRGGQYQIILSDGTHVWLNALSSIRFPVTFRGGSRNIEITGESYLEVAKDKKRPFQVSVNGVNIQVLGTAFNINAYADEAGIKTTLIQGSLKLLRNDKTLLLSPGEEGLAGKQPDLVLNKHPNLEQVLAWKNGYFSFDGAGIETVMQQLSRWYDVEVRYEGNPGKRSFDGQIGRNLNLSEVLNGLSASNVHFKIEGRILTVLP